MNPTVKCIERFQGVADELAAEGISSTRNRRREPHTAFKWR
jgi:hypothetical protein